MTFNVKKGTSSINESFVDFSYAYMLGLLYRAIKQGQTGQELWHIAHTLKPLNLLKGDSHIAEIVADIEAYADNNLSNSKQFPMSWRSAACQTIEKRLSVVPVFPEWNSSAAQNELNLREFFKQMRAFVAALAQKTKQEIDYSVKGSKLVVPAHYRLSLFIIFINTLYNSVIHAFPKEWSGIKKIIMVDIFEQNGYVFIEQRDNGVGTETLDSFYSGFGTQSVVKEARRIKAEIEITAQSGQGTIVRLKINKKQRTG